jgi:mannose-6-phosphate isomerase-like protein (cupin superfamily)
MRSDLPAEGIPKMFIEPTKTYVSLCADGTSKQFPGGAAFWSLPMQELERVGSTWLVTEHECSENWPSWEIHPNADEFVYLIEGAATLLLEQGTSIREIDIVGGNGVVVPKGTWHTLKTNAHCRMLFVTMGAGTRNRPA